MSSERTTGQRHISCNAYAYVHTAAMHTSGRDSALESSPKSGIDTVVSTAVVPLARSQNHNLSEQQLICTNLIMEMYKSTKHDISATGASIDGGSSFCGGVRGALECGELSAASLVNHAVVAEPPLLGAICSLSSMSNMSSCRNMSSGNVGSHAGCGNSTRPVFFTIEESTASASNDQVDYENIKYVKLFSILCWWCFPITGIMSIVFSFLSDKDFKRQDTKRAKRRLKISEVLLMVTIFFGLSLFAGMGFSFFQLYMTNWKGSAGNKNFEPYGIHH